MRVTAIPVFNSYNTDTKTNNTYKLYKNLNNNLNSNNVTNIEFTGRNPITGLFNYVKAQRYANMLAKYINSENKPYLFRNFRMEPLEGIQYGIPVFNGLSMKDIQYLSENLHVIAVKRGCTNMCGHCYADAKPSNREMSWEDFKMITGGFKKLRKRLHYIDIYGIEINKTPHGIIDTTTEMFYDADCMNIALKDKKGNVHDFIDLSEELYNSLARKTVFDTSGWDKNNLKMQTRAEKYTEYFSKSENMEKFNQFNVSFNVFNASYIASIKARKAGDIAKADKLRNKFTDNMANVLYTFTPLLQHPQYNILTRCFNFEAKNAYKFGPNSMLKLMEEVINKVRELYIKDFQGNQKYIKSEAEINSNINNLFNKMNAIDTSLNSVGRMRAFMNEFKIKANMQDHTQTTKYMIENLKELGRFHTIIADRLIDTDGKVYHMDYARFIPTEIQLNIKGKNSPTPRLANIVENFVLSRNIINRPEKH